MAGKGGYQPPVNPDRFSGIGKDSGRTDGQPGQTGEEMSNYLSSQATGKNQALQQVTDSMANAGSASPTKPSSNISSIVSPSNRPDEPVTDGNPLGAGRGADPRLTVDDTVDRKTLEPLLQLLKNAEANGNSSQATRNLIRRIDLKLIQQSYLG